MTVLVHATPWVEKTGAETTINLPIHASAEAGDIVVAGWTLNSATLPGAQSGWTLLDNQGSTVDTLAPSCGLYRKTVSGTDVTNGFVTLPTIPASVGSGAAIVLQGFTTTQDFTLVPLDKTATSTSFAFGTQVVTMAGVCAIYLVGQNTVQADVFTPPTNYTEIGDRSVGRNATMGYRVYSAAENPTGAITPVSGATTRGVGILAAFRPTAVPGDAKFAGFF